MTENRKPRVLLTSVYRPFAIDNEDSRKANPLELFHNQVTKSQGPFSPRMSHRSAGLLFIASNISAPTVVLDTPTFKEFKKEITDNFYDYIGIGSIVINFKKVERMVKTIRELSPKSKIVLGSHIAAFEEVKDLIPVDYVVKGEGVGWFRKELGEDADAPIKHPSIVASYDKEAMGVPTPLSIGWLVPGLGCPHGCDFCCTSAFFEGYIFYLKTGKELFDVCCQIEKDLDAIDFFILDENFMQREKRVREFLDLMKKHNKYWSFSIFSSISALKKYDMDFLTELGIDAIWIGLESKYQQYPKQKGAEAPEFVRELKKNGFVVLGSTILGVPAHTKEKIKEEIDYAIGMETALHQYMLYSPAPTTPLYRKTKAEGVLRTDMAWEDQHGQYQFNWKHPNITAEESEKLLQLAFDEDYRRLGPSLLRLIEAKLYKIRRNINSTEKLTMERNKIQIAALKEQYIPALWTMQKYFALHNRPISKKAKRIRLEIQEFFNMGKGASLRTRLIGSLLLVTTIYSKIKRDILKIPLEPKTFREEFNM